MNGHIGKLLDFSESRWLTFKTEKKLYLNFTPLCFWPLKQLEITLMLKKKKKTTEDLGSRADLIWNQIIFSLMCYQMNFVFKSSPSLEIVLHIIHSQSEAMWAVSETSWLHWYSSDQVKGLNSVFPIYTKTICIKKLKKNLPAFAP